MFKSSMKILICVAFALCSVQGQLVDGGNSTNTTDVDVSCPMYKTSDDCLLKGMGGCKWAPLQAVCVNADDTIPDPAKESPVSYFNEAQCSETCKDEASCLAKSQSGLCSPNNATFAAAIGVAITNQTFRDLMLQKCDLPLKTCMANAKMSSTVCASVRTCINTVTECLGGVFFERQDIISVPAIAACIASRDPAKGAGWPVECKAAVCTGKVPLFSQGMPPLDEWLPLIQGCSPNSVCDPRAPAPKMVEVKIVITMKSKVNGIAFSYYQTAAVEAQNAFKNSLVNDLYVSLGLDRNKVKIEVKEIYSGSIAFDYVVEKAVIQEEGAPAPSYPTLPSANSELTSVSSIMSSLENDLKVPTAELASVTVITTSDPVVNKIVTAQTSQPTSTPQGTTGSQTTSTPGPQGTTGPQGTPSSTLDIGNGSPMVGCLLALVAALAALVLFL